MMKKPINATNLTFSKDLSLTLQKNKKNFEVYFQKVEEQTSSEKKFVPKLKSKQLLREPKFFFGVERKKQRKEFSEPFFQEIKCNNPEMRGSKTKSFNKKMFPRRKESFRQRFITKTPQASRKINKKSFSYSNQTAIEEDEPQMQPLPTNSSYNFERELTPSMRTLKRPNFNKNISFLIRQRKQMKTKTSLFKMTESKQKMQRFQTNFDANNH